MNNKETNTFLDKQDEKLIKLFTLKQYMKELDVIANGLEKQYQEIPVDIRTTNSKANRIT